MCGIAPPTATQKKYFNTLKQLRLMILETPKQWVNSKSLAIKLQWAHVYLALVQYCYTGLKEIV